MKSFLTSLLTETETETSSFYRRVDRRLINLVVEVISSVMIGIRAESSFFSKINLKKYLFTLEKMS